MIDWTRSIYFGRDHGEYRAFMFERARNWRRGGDVVCEQREMTPSATEVLGGMFFYASLSLI